MNPRNPLVSICIPAYNGSHLIHKAIESCLEQSYPNLEVVVVDDASTDSTAQKIRNYAQHDSRVKLFKNPANLGLSLNWFKTVELASGEFIQFLGQDDWLDKNNIEAKISIFRDYEQVGVVGSPFQCYETSENSGEIRLISRMTKRVGFFSSDYIFKNFYRSLGYIGPFCMARRADILAGLIPVVPNKWGYDAYYSKGIAIDSLMFLNVLSHYPFMYYTDKTCYHSLSHPNNASKRYGLNHHNMADMVKFWHITRVGFEHFYSGKGSQYRLRFRTYEGNRLLAQVLLGFLLGRSSSFSLKPLKNFFSDYSLAEKVSTALYFPIHLLDRIRSRCKRLLTPPLKSQQKRCT